MKTLLRILITINLFIAILLGMVFVVANSENVDEVERIQAEYNALAAIANMVGAGDEIGDLPSPAAFQRAVYVDMIFLLACIAGIVFTFLKSKKGGLIVAASIAVLAILLYVFQPMLNGEQFKDDNDDKTFALVVAIGTLIGAGLLALLKLKFSNSETQPLQQAPFPSDQAAG